MGAGPRKKSGSAQGWAGPKEILWEPGAGLKNLVSFIELDIG